VSANGKTYKGVYADPKTGTFYYSVVVGKHPDGRPKRQLKRGFKTRGTADRARREVLLAVEDRNHVQRSRETVGEFFTRWLPAIEHTVRPSTFASYAMNIRTHVVPALGGTVLQEIGPEALNAFYSKLLKGGLSPSTVAYIHVIVHSALDDAMRWGSVVRNVSTLANPPRRQSAKAAMRAWTKEDVSGFLTSLEGDRLYPVFLLAATTGMRRGELLGLKWGDVDLEASRAALQETRIVINHLPTASKPKREDSRRSVPLAPETVAALRAWRARQAEERLAGGPEYATTDFVFTEPKGEPLHPAAVSKAFLSRLRKAGLRRIRLHDVRHTFATLALQAGVPLKVVSEILGHKDITITANLYQHVTPSMMEQATSTVAGLIFSP
jgi:integrase